MEDDGDGLGDPLAVGTIPLVTSRGWSGCRTTCQSPIPTTKTSATTMAAAQLGPERSVRAAVSASKTRVP